VPFTSDETLAYVRSVFSAPSDPDRLATWLHQKTFGHPYFLAFVCRQLALRTPQPRRLEQIWPAIFAQLGREKFRSDISQLSGKEIELIRQFAKLGDGEFAVHHLTTKFQTEYFARLTEKGLSFARDEGDTSSITRCLRAHGTNRCRKTKQEFAFTGLIRCGYCGCAVTADRKKEKYSYYRCTWHKGHCPEAPVREEVLAAQFAKCLESISLDEEILSLAVRALKESHGIEQRTHDAAISQLQKRYQVLQHRIDGAYIDKLDGQISAEFFDDRTREWREDQTRVLADLRSHQKANTGYLQTGIQILELINGAHRRFKTQTSVEKKELLKFVVSNSTWKNGVLNVEFRKPFSLLVLGRINPEGVDTAAEGETLGKNNWLLR
jgi:hypothetical protein